MLSEHHLLIHGPYQAPSPRPGDRAYCFFRNCEVVITSISKSRLPWPVCKQLQHRAGQGLLVDDVLARAVRMESASAVGYWWGVNPKVVWQWRRKLGVTRRNNSSSRMLNIKAASAGGRARKESLAKLPKHSTIQKKPVRPRWSVADLQVLKNELNDAKVAARTGRSVVAVKLMRQRLYARSGNERKKAPASYSGAFFYIPLMAIHRPYRPVSMIGISRFLGLIRKW